MSTHSLAVSFNATSTASSTSSNFVNIEQILPPTSTDIIDMGVIYRLWQRAKDGIPAGKYRTLGCPISFMDDEILVWFDFYVYPSSPELPYEVFPNIGVISAPTITSVAKDYDIVFPMSDTYELDFYPLKASLKWVTPCYNSDGELVTSPSLELDGTSIKLPEKVFGVARMTASAYARQYTLNVVFEKGEDKIKNFTPVVTASWTSVGGDAEEAQITFEVPKCVEYALNLCDGLIGVIHCHSLKQGIFVYYSICDGSVIGVAPTDMESWCEDIPL